MEAIAFYDAKEDQKKVDFYTKKMMNLKTNPNIQQELEKAYQAEEKKRLISENVSPEEKKRIKQEILENNKNKKHTSFTANLIEAAQASADKNDAILAADFISQFDELAALVKERSLKREKLSKSTNKPRRNSQGDSNKKVELLAVPSHPTLEIPDDLEKPENEDLLPKSARSTNKKNFFNRIKTGSKKKSIIKKSTNSEEGHVNISEFNPTGQNPILDHEIQEEIRKAELELQAEIEEAEKEAKELEEQLQRELEEEESKITKNEFISITVAPVDLDDNTITISPPRKKGIIINNSRQNRLIALKVEE